MLEYILRAYKQILRYKGRNLVIISGLIIMVSIATVVLTFSIRLDSFFQEKDLEQLKVYQYLHILPPRGIPLAELPSENKQVDGDSINEIKAIDGVESVLPFTSASIGYPNLKFTIAGYQILPLYIAYYDPDYYLDFFQGDLLSEERSPTSGVIVSSDIRKYMLPVEEYQELFDTSDSGQQSIPNGNLLNSYINGDMPIEKKQLNLPLVNKELEIIADYLYEPEKNFASSLQIAAVIKPDYSLMRKELILVPGDQKAKVRNNNNVSSVEYDSLYIKTETIKDVPRIVEEINQLGYFTSTNIDALKKYFQMYQENLNNVILLMGMILLIAVIGYINTVQSSIQERRNEFAIMKALGATSTQIITGVVLEGMIIAGIASLIGFALAKAFIGTISYLINVGAISPTIFLAFGLQKESALYIMQIPLSVYYYIGGVTLLAGFIMTYLPASHFFKQDFLSLMKKG